MIKNELLKETIDQLKPSSELSVSEWAAKHRVMSATDSPVPGTIFNINRAPYLKGIMDQFSNNKNRMIVFKAGTQIGKTNAMLNMMGWKLAERPAPMMLCLPSGESVERFSTTRIDAMVDASPQLKKLKGKIQRRQEKSYIGSTLYLVSAQSSSQMSSSSIEAVFLDELKDWPATFGGKNNASPAKYALDRTKTFKFTKKAVLVSSPSHEDSEINKYYQTCQAKLWYWVTCPHCQEKLLFDFKQIKFGEQYFEFDDTLDKDSPDFWANAKKHAYYECQHCSKEIHDKHKPKMVREGEWLDEYCEPMDADIESVGYTLSSIYSLDLDFGHIAAEFLESKNDRGKIENFICSWLAEDWKEKTIGQSVEELQDNICSLLPAELPEGTIAVTAGIDAQKDHFYYSINAHTLTNSYMIMYGTLRTFDEVSDLVHNSEFKLPGTNQTIGIWRAALDTGGGQKEDGTSMTEAAYQFIRAEGRGKIFAIKGKSKNTTGSRISMSVLDKFPNGKPMRGGLSLFLLNTSELKDSLQWKLSREEGEDQKLYFHSATDDIWMSHMTAEAKVQDSRGNWSWKQVKKRNDYFDTQVYNLALIDAQMMGGLSMIQNPVGLKNTKHKTKLNKQSNNNGYLADVKRGSWMKG